MHFAAKFIYKPNVVNKPKPFGALLWSHAQGTYHSRRSFLDNATTEKFRDLALRELLFVACPNLGTHTVHRYRAY
jgi:hypothetical protein